MKLLDLTGQRFGRLTVIERAQSKDKNTAWRCKCDCGNYKIVSGPNLRAGKSRSCGCGVIESVITRSKTHGESNRTRLYRIWKGMKDRCRRKSHINYERYGGRGITVCPEWEHSYEKFRDWALSHGYRDNLTIDRIDNDKGYSPDNCRWATYSEQSTNKSNNHIIAYHGESKPLTRWAREAGISYATLQRRLKRGWDIESALITPAYKEKSKPNN